MKQPEQKRKTLQHMNFAVRGLSIALLLGGTILLAHPARALFPELNQQLDIRHNNSTQGDARNEADRLTRLGGRQEQAGQFEKAIASWKEALELYHQIGDLEAKGRLYDYLGITYGRLGFYPEAEDALRRRLAIARDTRDFQGQIYGLNNVGTLLLQQGSLSDALAAFKEGLEVSNSVRHMEGMGLSLSNIGLVAAESGDYSQAIKQYKAALKFRRRASDAVGEAVTWNHLGDVHQAIEEYKEAAAAYGAALRLARQARDPGNRLRAIDGLAPAHQAAVGRYGYAVELLGERLAVSRDLENLPQQLISMHSLAKLYEEMNEPETALRFYRLALALARQLEDVQVENEVMNTLIRLGDF